MIKCSYDYKPIEYTKRIQDLVKLLELNSFRFLCVHVSTFDGSISAEYKINQDDYRKLHTYLNDNEVQPWSRWKHFIFKIKRLFGI